MMIVETGTGPMPVAPISWNSHGTDPAVPWKFVFEHALQDQSDAESGDESVDLEHRDDQPVRQADARHRRAA